MSSIEGGRVVSFVKYSDEHLERVLRITRAAWSPVFPLMREEVPSYVYEAFYPAGWLQRQLHDVEATCNDIETEIWLAMLDQTIAGFVGLRVHNEDSMGEIYIVAVDPAFQRLGVGRALLDFSFAWMREQDLKIALVETGADRGHEPARATYESMGFERYPVARYFKEL